MNYCDYDWNNSLAKIPWSRGYEFFEKVKIDFEKRVILGSGGGIILWNEMETKAWEVARSMQCIISENTRGYEIRKSTVEER